MSAQKSQRSLTQIIKKNQVDELTTKVELLEEELKKNEILLINLEKLSSLGQFVREIVHELKNPLTAISGFTELGKLAKTKKSREEYLNKIPKFIHQITGRLSQFRAMTFNTGMKYERVDLVQVLAECLSTLELLKPKGTDIESSFVSTDCHIMGDAEQMIQVFLGISRSYFNYMKERKSSLIVKTEIFSSDELKSRNKEIDVSLWSLEDWNKKFEKSNQWIKITFENRKISVPKEKISVAFNSCKKATNLDKIQELGLVIACDIVKRHHGVIYTKKLKDTGFSLHICIPKCD